MKASHSARMDILAFLFMLLAFYTFRLAEDKKNKFLFAIPGILGAMSGLTHPAGFFIVLILTILLLIQKSDIKDKFTGIFILILPSIGFTLLWLWSMRSN